MKQSVLRHQRIKKTCYLSEELNLLSTLILFKVLNIIRSILYYMISFFFKTISVKLSCHFFRFIPEHCFNTLILLLKFNLPFLYIITRYCVHTRQWFHHLFLWWVPKRQIPQFPNTRIFFSPNKQNPFTPPMESLALAG